MNNWRPQLYRKKGKELGVDPEVITHAIEIGTSITRKHRSIPPIFTLKHLALVSEVPVHKLRRVVSRDERYGYHYRFFQIKKRSKKGCNAGKRFICIPSEDLMRVQKCINSLILSKIPSHSASFAYTKGISIRDAANVHCGCRWLIKLDIRSYFESISERSVYKVFRSVGFPALLSFEMARICTRVIPRKELDVNSRWTTLRYKRGRITSYRNWNVGSLPHGAPSSPMLANLASIQFDEDIADIASKHGLEYTRYADDIALSTDNDAFSRGQASKVIQEVYCAMRRYGFEPNTAKASVTPPGGRKVVLGLLVDGPFPRLTREFRSNIKQHLYFCKKAGWGPAKHARNRNFASVIGFKNHLFGLISYAMQIDPDFGRKMRQDFEGIAWPL